MTATQIPANTASTRPGPEPNNRSNFSPPRPEGPTDNTPEKFCPTPLTFIGRQKQGSAPLTLWAEAVAQRLSMSAWVYDFFWNTHQNFLESRREQGSLLPPDVREWFPADHLAWFVIDAVAEVVLTRCLPPIGLMVTVEAAYEPSVMVTLILHAFATNVRSSPAISGIVVRTYLSGDHGEPGA